MIDFELKNGPTWNRSGPIECPSSSTSIPASRLSESTAIVSGSPAGTIVFPSLVSSTGLPSRCSSFPLADCAAKQTVANANTRPHRILIPW